MGLYSFSYNPVYGHWSIFFDGNKHTKLHTASHYDALILIEQLNNSITGFEIIFHAGDWKIFCCEKNFLPKRYHYPNYVSPMTGRSDYNGFDNEFKTLTRAQLYLRTQLPFLSTHVLNREVLSLV